ncbi:MAG: hypothetical protein ACI4W2_04815 [Eubacterium sp.]
MLEGQIISIPIGMVCVELKDYSELLRKSVVAGSLRKKNKVVRHESTTKETEAPQKAQESVTDGDAESTAPEVKGLDTLIGSLDSAPEARHSGRPKKGEGGLDDKELMKLRARGYKMTQLVSALGYSERTIRNHLKAIEEQHPNEARKYARQTSIG